MSKVPVLDRTVHKTYEWLQDIEKELEIDNARSAYAALRATLHGLRDQLRTDEVAQLGAQLPTLLRGVYYEGWNPHQDAARRPARGVFLDGIGRDLRDHPELTPERAVAAVMTVLTERISEGEIDQILAQLPKDIRTLWIDGVR